MNYFVLRDGKQEGPYALSELQQLSLRGDMMQTDLVRAEGTEEWSPLPQLLAKIGSE